MKMPLMFALLIITQLGLQTAYGKDEPQSSNPQTEALKAELKNLNLTKPEKDLEINAEKLDFRFI